MSVYIVYGAPASGKTTYVHDVMGSNDIVYDFDDIMRIITGQPYQTVNNNAVGYVLDIRDAIINRLKNDDRISNAYFINSFVGKNFEQSLSGLEVRFIKMETERDICIKRIEESERKNKERLYETVYEWFDKYGALGKHIPLKEKKKIYNSIAWRKKRQEILERDNHECVWCAAQGKVTTNDRETLEIDHIIEIDKDAELIFNNNNLRTLCRSCHSIRHKRYKRNPIKLNGTKNKWNEDEKW